MLGGSVGSCASGYECKGLSIVGKVAVPWNSSDLKAVASGAAWSDDWNYIGYEGEVHYGDFWGNDVYEDMILIDAAPKAGLAFKYSTIPGHVETIYTDVSVNLRRADGENGTTDAVGKVGYSIQEQNVGANIGPAPSLTLTPSTAVYQKADTVSFYY